jgi:hypothetical protein
VSGSGSRRSFTAIALTAAGLCCIAPAVFSAGPVTVGLFMAGVVLVLAGVLVSALSLPALLRRRGRD